QGTVLIGTPGANALTTVLTGGFGAFGGVGDDSLTGRPGADLLDGGGGVDTLLFGTATGGVVADLGNGAAFAIDVPSIVDTLRGVENVTGTAFGDRLSGDAAGNVLKGSGGADTLSGRDGSDTLDG